MTDFDTPHSEVSSAEAKDTAHTAESSKEIEEEEGFVRHPIFYSVFTYVLLSLLFLHPSTPLIVYADDLGIVRAFEFVCLSIPLFFISGAVLIVKTPQRMIIPLLLSTYFAAPSLSCLSTSARMEFFEEKVSDTSSYPANEIIDRARQDRYSESWVKQGSENSSKYSLIHAHYSQGGTGVIQSQVLAVVQSKKDSTYEVHSSVQYTYSGNRPQGSNIDLIVPLRVIPFSNGQFWFKKEQGASVNQLLFLNSDWRFQKRSFYWVLLPFLSSLIPLFAFVIWRSQIRRAFMAYGAIFGFWCLAFAPWQYLGFAYL